MMILKAICIILILKITEGKLSAREGRLGLILEALQEIQVDVSALQEQQDGMFAQVANIQEAQNKMRAEIQEARRTLKMDEDQPIVKRPSGQFVNQNYSIAFFTLRATPLVAPEGSNVTITWEEVVTELGQGWNATTGIFTAYLRGIYAFHINVIAFGIEAGPAHVDVVRNTEVVLQVHATDASQRAHATGNIVLVLQAGDTVRPVLRAGNEMFANINHIPHFTGYLITELAN